ncbi:hypothetical protein PQX77_005370 [Marasmius sp. AFHP31]|nr:hypothetical protein PQX77_005370 [Marasmius sp. AFHP31]
MKRPKQSSEEQTAAIPGPTTKGQKQLNQPQNRAVEATKIKQPSKNLNLDTSQRRTKLKAKAPSQPCSTTTPLHEKTIASILNPTGSKYSGLKFPRHGQ